MAVAGDVVDPNVPADVTDPYVLALALQLTKGGLQVTVVSEDVVDRLPAKISMATACNRLGLQHCDTNSLLVSIGADPIT